MVEAVDVLQQRFDAIVGRGSSLLYACCMGLGYEFR